MRTMRKQFALLLLILHATTYSFIPEKLKQCFSTIRTINNTSEQSQALQTTYELLDNNEISIAPTILANAIEDTLVLLEKNRTKFNDFFDIDAMVDYLDTYLNIIDLNNPLLTRNCNTTQCAQYECCPGLQYECCPGPRGSRGPRGHRGRRGATGNTGATGATGSSLECGVNSLFINASMMTDLYNANPNASFNNVYGPSTSFSTAPIAAWEIAIAFFQPVPKAMQFAIPNDIDTTQPITLTIHCFNSPNVEASGFVAFQVQTDYKSNGFEIGTSAPATGFSENLTTPNHLVVDPVGSGVDQENLRYFTTSVPLDGTLIAGNTWAYVSLFRVDPSDDENDYSASVYLTAVSIEYTRLCQPLP